MDVKKKIMIVEDQPLLNAMLKEELSKYYKVVATCTSAKDMPQFCDKYKPDLILTDVLTKDNVSGIEYGKLIKDKYKDKIKVLAITGVPEISFLNKAKAYKLDGLIYKDIKPSDLVSSINNVLNGYTLYPGGFNTTEKVVNFNELTDKELQILELLCNGLDRKEIAKEVDLTNGTLKNYISSILNKLHFTSVTQLTLFCVTNNYIIPQTK